MKTPTRLPHLELVENVFDYDPLTGIISRDGKQLTGNHDRSSGAIKIKVSKQHAVYAHRLAWLLYYRKDPAPLYVEHINGNRRDNRIVNLRLKRKPTRKS